MLAYNLGVYLMKQAKQWKPAECYADQFDFQTWVCHCHNGHVFTGPTMEDAENARARYYNVTLPHHPIYNQGN